MVMEQLTSSNRITNIYSFCATSSLVEYAPGNLNKYVMPTDGMKEVDDEVDDDDPTPVNNIGAEEKLEMSLELAKGLAAMHGHSGGVIANVDVQLGQFSRGKDGLIKILDFNRAEAMLYDEIEDEYCKFENGSPPNGSVSSLFVWNGMLCSLMLPCTNTLVIATGGCRLRCSFTYCRDTRNVLVSCERILTSISNRTQPLASRPQLCFLISDFFQAPRLSSHLPVDIIIHLTDIATLTQTQHPCPFSPACFVIHLSYVRPKKWKAPH